MVKLLKEQIEDYATSHSPPRCVDCDEDCWLVENKMKCWLGGTTYDASTGTTYETDLATGYCPWLMPGLEFPPRGTND